MYHLLCTVTLLWLLQVSSALECYSCSVGSDKKPCPGQGTIEAKEGEICYSVIAGSGDIYQQGAMPINMCDDPRQQAMAMATYDIKRANVQCCPGPKCNGGHILNRFEMRRQHLQRGSFEDEERNGIEEDEGSEAAAIRKEIRESNWRSKIVHGWEDPDEEEMFGGRGREVKDDFEVVTTTPLPPTEAPSKRVKRGTDSDDCNPETEHQCKEGTCIPKHRLCDKVTNCINGEDEDASEDGLCPLHDLEHEFSQQMYAATGDCGHTCPENQDQCIPDHWVCDGVEDCDEGSDEKEGYCSQFCARDDMFKCHDGKTCIPQQFRCDKLVDCSQGEDEQDCLSYILEAKDIIEEGEEPNYKMKEGPNGENIVAVYTDCSFECGDVDGTCLPEHWECNGEMECPNGIDEHSQCWEFCQKEDRYQCEEENKCIPKAQMCDVFDDCSGGDDEQGCQSWLMDYLGMSSVQEQDYSFEWNPDSVKNFLEYLEVPPTSGEDKDEYGMNLWKKKEEMKQRIQQGEERMKGKKRAHRGK